jgi:RNA polymerase sigma factor (sigma-70 family)
VSDDDLSLARRCAAGDEDAWTAVVARYRSFMVGFARRIVDETAAADITDAVIADLWQRGKIARFEGRSSLRTWLGALVANAALNWRRTLPPDAADERGEEPRGEDEPADRESAALVSRALAESIAALADDDRLLILMHYEQDLSLSQCGAVLGKSKSTLSRRLAAIREQVRAEADRIARQRYGAPIDRLRAGLDASTLDLDLRAVCTGAGNARTPRVSKE